MQLKHSHVVAALSVLLAGCASGSLRGAEVAGAPPASAVAVFTAPTCQSADGAMPGSQASYHLAREHGGWVLYEVEANGAGTRITNGWTDGAGFHFFAWVRNGPGWLYSFPPDSSDQPVRHVFPAGTYSGDERGGVTRPSGSPMASCPMIARVPGAIPGSGAGMSAGGQAIPGAMPAERPPPLAQRSSTAEPSPMADPSPMEPSPALPVAARPPEEAPTAAAPSPEHAASPRVPRCEGDDTLGAQQAAARGRALYRRAAAAPGGPDVAGVRQALAEFDAQCAMGDDWALELRASALFVLGRHVEAMDSLDAFLAAHPSDTLPSEVRARIEANLPMLEQRIATLRASGNTPGGMIRIDGGEWRPLDGRPLRVEPGEVRVEVSARGRVVIDATETLAAGSTTVREYDLTAAVSPPVATPSPRVTPEPEPSPVAISPSEMARLDSEVPPGLGAQETPERRELPPPEARATGGGVDLIPWIATTGVLGGVSFVLGPILLVLSDDQYASYVERCTDGQWHELCPTVLSESDTTLTASYAMFGLGGIFVATAITLGIIQAVVGAPASDDGADARFTCAPGLLGLACEGRF